MSSPLNVLVAGETRSSGWVSGGFDTSFGAPFGGNDPDAFVVKLSPTGDHLWSTYLGGTFGDSGKGIALDAVDPDGLVWVLVNPQ